MNNSINLTIFWATFLGSALSYGSTISVNFTDDDSTATTVLTTEIAGYAEIPGAAVINWNNLNADTPDNSEDDPPLIGDIIDDSGAVLAGVTVSWDISNGQDHTRNGDPSNGNDRLMEGFLDFGNPPAGAGGTITVENVPYERYHVVVYIDGRNPPEDRFATYAVNGGAAVDFVDPMATNWKSTDDGNLNPDGVFQLAVPGGTRGNLYGTIPFGDPTGNEGNVLYFEDMTGSTLTIEALVNNSNGAGFPRSPINGFQIIEVPTNDISITDCSFEEGAREFTLTFDSMTGTNYQVEMSTTLMADDWAAVGPLLSATSSSTITTVGSADIPAGNGPVFFRVAQP